MDQREQEQRPVRREYGSSTAADSIGQARRVIDQLEARINDARRVPMSKTLSIVDAGELIDLIGQLRIVLPHTVVQAQAILDMRLARLTGLERERLQEEYAELEKTIAYLRAVLADEKMVLGIIREEILAIKAKYADERRTQISLMDGEIDPEDLIQEDSVVVTLTHFGYVKRIPRATYRSQNRGGKGIMGMTTREEDYAEQMLVTSTHDEIMFFTNRGRVYSLKGYEIPEAGRAARGTAIVNLLQLTGGEKVTAMIPLPRESEGKYLTMATRFGLIKKTALDEFANLRKAGLIAIVLREDDELIGVELTDDDDELMLATRQGQAIRFKETDIRSMGRNSMGVKSFDLAENDEVISVARIEAGKQVLAITQNGYGKRTDVSEFRVQSRGGKGIMAMRLTDKTGLMAAQLLVSEDEDIMLITDHINFMGANPLRGTNDDSTGPRFCDMTHTYTPELQEKALAVAKKQNILLQKGVYLGYMGPSFETPAEIRAFRVLGADAVGMSTVPEAIAASHCDLPVVALSLITNMAAGMAGKRLDGAEVIEIADRRGPVFQKLVKGIVEVL